MLTEAQRDMIFKHAYIPEHLVDYVQTVSPAEPYLHEGYLCFSRSDILILIGYPLPVIPDGQSGQDIQEVIESVCERFQPGAITVMAPGIKPERDADEYFGLDLPLCDVKPGEAYMLRRAGRELTVAESAFCKDHEALIESFLRERNLGAAHQWIFRSIPQYLERSKTARLIEARKGEELISFTILDLGSADYGFYLFNFRSRGNHVPGATDILFYEMARISAREGKLRLNLGLGVNPDIRRFKEKWGGKPFLGCDWVTIQRDRLGLMDKIRRLFRRQARRK